jgi:hypothetical protein
MARGLDADSGQSEGRPDGSVVLSVAQVVAVHPPAFSDPAEFGSRLALGVTVSGVLVGLAEPATLPASGRSTGQDGTSGTPPGSGEDSIIRRSRLQRKRFFGDWQVPIFR